MFGLHLSEDLMIMPRLRMCSEIYAAPSLSTLKYESGDFL